MYKNSVVIMETLAGLIKRLREKQGWTYYRLSKESGLYQCYISRLENGEIKNIRMETAQKLSKAFKVDPVIFLQVMGEPEAEISPPIELVSIPILGRVSAGELELREQMPFGEVGVQKIGKASHSTPKTHYAVIVSGNSLEPEIHDGDKILIERNPEFIAGQIYVVKVDDHVALRKVSQEGDKYRLNSNNGHHIDEVVDFDRVELQGRAVARINQEDLYGGR